jgi:hypothetical protein
MGLMSGAYDNLPFVAKIESRRLCGTATATRRRWRLMAVWGVRAGALAFEAFSYIRTLVSLGLERRTTARYEATLRQAEGLAISKALDEGLGKAVLLCVSFLTFALGFW